jgi:hypothetical protein
MLALVGLIAMLPVVGMVVTTAVIVLARVVDRSTTALLRRRQVRGGKGRSDGFVAVAASPVHLLTAALITVPCLVPPLLVGVTTGGLAALVAAAAQGFHWGPLSGVSVAVGAFFGLLTAWWGPGGKSLRRGSRAGLRSAIRPAWLSTLIAAALLAVAAVELLNAIHGGGTVWAPLNAPFDTSDLPSRPGLDNLRDLPLVRDLPFVSR